MARKATAAAKAGKPRKSKARVEAPATRPSKRSWVRIAAMGAGLVAVALVAHAFWVLPPRDEVARLARVPPPTTALIEARAREAHENGHKVRRVQTWVAMGDVAPELLACVIASEDARFFEHDGVDLAQLRDAMKRDLVAHRYARGASTLTQQLAKNLWLSESKSVLRKLQELVLARRLEEELPKDRILELYLNEVEWGDGIYGVGAASRAYFGHPPRALSLAESAELAAMLPAPRHLSPAKDAAALHARAEHVLDRVAAEHLANETAIDLARVELARNLDSRSRS